MCEAVRTAVGRRGGRLAGWHPTDLLGAVLAGVLERAGVDPGHVDDVQAGCVTQAGEQAANVARNAWLAAGLPETVPATTVDRQCGSSQQALHNAAAAVASGAQDVVIAAGVESMTRAPMGSAAGQADPFGATLRARYPEGVAAQGLSAERIAARWGLTRAACDALALASHRRAVDATDRGDLAGEILAVTGTDRDGAAVVHATDEGIRRDTSASALAALPPAFRTDALASAHPGLPWLVTAGNASQVSDGAAALLVTAPEVAQRLGLTPRWRIRATTVVGSDPVLMLTGPIPATRRLLERAGLALDDLDHIEINEAFAPVVLAWQTELGADPERVNPLGGAIALGHPLGAYGARLATTLAHALERTGGRLGLQVMCEGGGMANATLLERLG